MRRAAAALTAAFVLAVVAACGTRAPTLPEASGPAPAAAPARPSLASEHKRLSALFEGTPVVFAMQADGSLRVTVPRRFCFDRAESSVKKPLAAVLDRIARSQAGSTSRLRVSAPPDAESRQATLARERALSTRDYLIGHGIGVARLQAVGVVQSDVVELVVADAAAP